MKTEAQRKTTCAENCICIECQKNRARREARASLFTELAEAFLSCGEKTWDDFREYIHLLRFEVKDDQRYKKALEALKSLLEGGGE